MNKYLVAGAGILLVAVLAFVLFSNKAGKKEVTTPIQTPANQTQATPSAQPTTQPANEQTVNVTKAGFEPETLKVKAGTTVTFVNKSGTTAAVNSAIHPTHALFPLLNLGTFNDGGSLSVKFDKPGTYKYHNHLNPSQTGEVVVE